MDEEAKYSKEQLLKSDRYAEYRDVLNTVLPEDGMYTINDINTAIQDFLDMPFPEAVNE